MKKYCFTLLLLFMVLMLAGCTYSIRTMGLDEQENDDDIKWDYRPMVYFEDKIYGETVSFLTELPNADLEPVAEICIEGKQHEPMKHEECYSNSLPIGSIIYASDDENIIYIGIIHPSKGKGYILYERLEETN